MCQFSAVYPSEHCKEKFWDAVFVYSVFCLLQNGGYLFYFFFFLILPLSKALIPIIRMVSFLSLLLISNSPETKLSAMEGQPSMPCSSRAGDCSSQLGLGGKACRSGRLRPGLIPALRQYLTEILHVGSELDLAVA